MSSIRLSYWQVFRLIFVIFFLYLMGDAFYRWDGFKYYASFLEFLPNVALITILWTILAVITAILIWLPIRAVQWFCLHIGRKVKLEHLLLFILIEMALFLGRGFFWKILYKVFVYTEIVYLFTTLAAIFLTWVFRDKAERWVNIIQERITPLVWIFGMFVILSVPLVAYHTWGKQTDNVVSQKLTHPSVADKNRPNIILITFDALTARDMSVYGYHRPTTPFISEWGNTASLFTRLQAESNFTTPTVASLMTGKRVWTHQTYHLGGSRPNRIDKESLPLLMKKNNGYYNMVFIQVRAASISILGMSENFDIAYYVGAFKTPNSLDEKINLATLYPLFGEKFRMYDWFWSAIREFLPRYFVDKIFSPQDTSVTVNPAEKALNKFLEIIDKIPPEPFFAWIHLAPPHHAYLPPEPYMGMFDSSPEMRTSKSQAKGFSSIELGCQNFSLKDQQTVDILRARYDEFIRYCDKQFEEFIEELAKRDMLENTVIILSSDHGESFEHGYLNHSGPHLYEQVTHIPLIIKGPNQTEGRIIDDIVEQIDIPATILDLAGIPVPSWMEGRSLVPLMRGKRLPSKPIFSMNFETNPSRGHQVTRGTIALWEGNYKLIHYLEANRSLLFNLKEDPDELNNLFDKESDVGQRLLVLN